LVNAIYAIPNGVMRMSQDMMGLVETSNNLAVCVKPENGTIEVKCLLRIVKSLNNRKLVF
jgi:dipeptidase D